MCLRSLVKLSYCMYDVMRIFWELINTYVAIKAYNEANILINMFVKEGHLVHAMKGCNNCSPIGVDGLLEFGSFDSDEVKQFAEEALSMNVRLIE